MRDFDLQGLAQVSISTDIPAHRRIVDGAISEITTLRQQLAESKKREATSFYQGVCTTLAMFDPHSTEYHEAVLQHGGYHVLWEVASDYDKEHLLAAAKANYGGGYEAWLSQESGQPSKKEGESHE